MGWYECVERIWIKLDINWKVSLDCHFEVVSSQQKNDTKIFIFLNKTQNIRIFEL